MKQILNSKPCCHWQAPRGTCLEVETCLAKKSLLTPSPYSGWSSNPSRPTLKNSLHAPPPLAWPCTHLEIHSVSTFLIKPHSQLRLLGCHALVCSFHLTDSADSPLGPQGSPNLSGPEITLHVVLMGLLTLAPPRMWASEDRDHVHSPLHCWCLRQTQACGWPSVNVCGRKGLSPTSHWASTCCLMTLAPWNNF